MAIRWGIASAGKISHDFVEAIHCLSSEEHAIVAVAARSQKNAESFAQQHSIAKAYEGYQLLANDKDIDIVYVGVINNLHLEVTKLMLKNGKHVLCEKPMGMNKREVEEMMSYAKKHKLFLMEAVWSRFFPVYHQLRKLLEDQAVGDVQYVNVSMGFPLQNVDRLSLKDLGGGTVLDLGIYTLQLQQVVFKGLKPIKLVAAGHMNKHKVDESANAVVVYPGGKTAVLSTSACITLPNEAVIVGTKGVIRIPNFWCPTTLITAEKTYTFDLPKSAGRFNFLNSVGLSYEADHVRKCLKDGLLESPLVPHSDSLELSTLMDAMRKEIGVIFSQDS